MTTFSAVEFDPDNGAFRVTGDSGARVFDSRYETQRIFLNGSADIPGRYGTGNNFFYTPGIVDVMYGETFGQVPYVLAVGRKLSPVNSDTDDQVNIRPPRIWWNSRAGSDFESIKGWLTCSLSDRLRLVNYHYRVNPSTPLNIDWGVARSWYSAFRNPV